MEITIRHTEDCPHVEVAEERVREALRRASRDATLRRELVRTPEEAERLSFTGSPTILVDGNDPFADPSSVAALACRMYASPKGAEGAPTVEELERALAGRS